MTIVDLRFEWGCCSWVLRSLFAHMGLLFCRSQLFIQPAGDLEHQYKESTTYIPWKEELHRSSSVTGRLQCPAVQRSFLPLVVNTVAEPDELSHISAHGEDWNPAYIIHLYPSLTLRNLLPYSLRYLLEVCLLYLVWIPALHKVNSSLFRGIFSWSQCFIYHTYSVLKVLMKARLELASALC